MFYLRQQNKITWKDVTPFPDQDVTPFPDQDVIHYDIVQANFRSKLDMTEAYEQMHIRPEDVCKTTFSTIFDTFQSQVMQMGDCNAPSTFQRLMTTIVKLLRSPSDCQDPVQSKINPLPLLQLHSNHPRRF